MKDIWKNILYTLFLIVCAFLASFAIHVILDKPHDGASLPVDETKPAKFIWTSMPPCYNYTQENCYFNHNKNQTFKMNCKSVVMGFNDNYSILLPIQSTCWICCGE